MRESLQQDDSNDNCAEHRLRTEMVSFLNPPEAVDANCLGRDPDK